MGINILCRRVAVEALTEDVSGTRSKDLAQDSAPAFLVDLIVRLGDEIVDRTCIRAIAIRSGKV